MVEVELVGARTATFAAAAAMLGAASPRREIPRLCRLAAAAAGVDNGHLAIEFVDADRIANLNAAFRDEPVPTDVLAFPIDGAAPATPRELGDVVICPEHTVDVREAIVHGVLHLLGFDHETDAGQMLALQRRLLARDDTTRVADAGRPA